MMHTLSSTVLSTNLLYSLLNTLYTYFDALFTDYNLSYFIEHGLAGVCNFSAVDNMVKRFTIVVG